MGKAGSARARRPSRQQEILARPLSSLMLFERRFMRAAALLWLASAGGMLWSGPGRAQEFSRDIPSHAHYSATEQGWTCDDGFRQAAGLCLQDTQDIPSQS